VQQSNVFGKVLAGRVGKRRAGGPRNMNAGQYDGKDVYLKIQTV
jgi:hypothetical protein